MNLFIYNAKESHKPYMTKKGFLPSFLTAFYYICFAGELDYTRGDLFIKVQLFQMSNITLSKITMVIINLAEVVIHRTCETIDGFDLNVVVVHSLQFKSF